MNNFNNLYIRQKIENFKNPVPINECVENNYAPFNLNHINEESSSCCIIL